MRRHFLMVLCVAAGFLTGCEDDSEPVADLGSNSPEVVVCAGDSITSGGYPEVMAGMIGKNVINGGQSGATTDLIADSLPGRLDRHKPGYVCILGGANDLITSRSQEFTLANLRRMIQDAKARQTVPVLGTLTPMTGTHDLWASGVTALNPRIRALAAEEGARLADLEKAFGGSPEQYLQGDGLHPNAAGNEIIARVFGSRAD